MSRGNDGRTGIGTGVLIVAALAALIGVLFLTDDHPDASGTGHDPVAINLPKTVEHQRELGSSSNVLTDSGDMTSGLTSSGLSASGLTELNQGVYGDSPGAAGNWAVTTSRNSGQAGPWLAAHAPSGQGVTVTHPRLSIAGATACYQQRDGRSMCTWYDENYFLMVTGPAGPQALQQVLLRVYDGSEV